MKDRNYAIDFIKTISIFAVVIIHVSTAYLDRSLPFNLSFDFLLFINQFSRFAVPLFFASSGFLLTLRYNGSFSTIEFYKKRLLRVLPPYIFWFLIYFFIVFQYPTIPILSFKFLNMFLTGTSSYQLYFIPIIIILYLCFPLFMKLNRLFLSKFFLFFLFIIICIILTFVYYGDFNLTLFPPINGTVYNLFPFLSGMYAALHQEKILKIANKYKFLVFFITICFGILIFSESFFLFRIFLIQKFLRDQWRPSVMIYALFSGIIFYRTYEKYLKKFNEKILFFSKYSFGVFFIHVAILTFLLTYIIDPLKFYNLFGFIFSLLTVFILSYILIYYASKIPKVGRIISAS